MEILSFVSFITAPLSVLRLVDKSIGVSNDVNDRLLASRVEPTYEKSVD